MKNDSFIQLCVNNILESLRDGLSHFSQPSRTAVIFALNHCDSLKILDPQNLLRGHEPKIRELFIESAQWRECGPESDILKFTEPIQDDRYHLSGLISYAARSLSVFFQIWLTEQHPDMCAIGPTERWLDYAASLFSQNCTTGNILSLGSSGYVLQECATHAVRDYIVDQRNIIMGWDTQLRVFPVLDAILGISKTVEEGQTPWGDLAFVEPVELSRVSFLARFPFLERPNLKNLKHVRKLLLAVEHSRRKLVSDGDSIIGVAQDPLPRASLVAAFRGGHGFLHLDDHPVCSFFDGSFHSTTRKANLVHIEEALLDSNLNPALQHDLYKLVAEIVQYAIDEEHGCTLVLDLDETRVRISGQKMERPLDLRPRRNLDLAKSLSKVDGALHLGIDLKLHGFACLLDGHAVPGENRARGARYNSALRFSAEHAKVIVVVVSSDRPVSVIQGGVEVTAVCEWTPVSTLTNQPTRLEQWL